MMTNFPDELTCDMAETYGIFDVKRVPARLLATLAVGLRDDSRVKKAKSGTVVEDNTLLLAYIVDLLRGITINDDNSILAYYLCPDREQEPAEHEVFENPEDFRARWEEVTRE